jgi:phage terminase large subunit GpA-like protein
MSSAQVGKSTLAKAAIGYFISQDPCPILFVAPTLEQGQSFSKDRLAPMFRDTTCLRGKVGDPKTRDSGSTILHRRFAGGHLTIVGANAPAGLASRPIRVVTQDMVARFTTAFAAARYHVDRALAGRFPRTMLCSAREDLEDAYDALPEQLRSMVDKVEAQLS